MQTYFKTWHQFDPPPYPPLPLLPLPVGYAPAAVPDPTWRTPMLTPEALAFVTAEAERKSTYSWQRTVRLAALNGVKL